MQYSLSFVIPCYQNEQNISDLITGIRDLLLALPSDCTPEFILVDDGSTDQTLKGLLDFKKVIPNTTIVKLTGNFGSYNALLAGLNHAKGDCCVQLHADLQDPPKHIPDMLAIWAKGIKLVIGHRVDREESLPHRLLALTYHSLIKKIALPNIPEGGYDLVLFDREIRDKIVAMNESNINLIYLISWLQYPYATIPITRVARTKGKSAWTFNKKTKLFADTIVGFSYWPIRAVTGMAIFGGLAFITLSAKALFDTASGHMHSAVFWLAYIILGCTTVLTIIASVIAEYLWRTLEAARRRPPFIIDKIL